MFPKKIRKQFIIILSFLLVFTIPSIAISKTKKKVEEPRVGRLYLKKACELAKGYLTDDEPRLASDGAWCLGYVMGFTESHIETMLLIDKKKKVRSELNQAGVIFCPDDKTTYLNLVDAILVHIDKTKQTKKETISTLIRDAFEKKYPCKIEPRK